MCISSGQSAPYSPEGAALGGYGLDAQSHLGLRTAGENCFCSFSLCAFVYMYIYYYLHYQTIALGKEN